ncbi:MAG TPA: phospho-N-acetylmuramoyl-pentapeptide-transferase [Chthonomonadaceae bacterium]|nr:phospho-N-acetylmuramoyl-pentapeptide-transferase [Chthonomonadaceae bacterium]
MANLLLGFVVAFLLAALPGRWTISQLRRLNARQNISEDAPTTHAAKQGTPTMGGLLILFSLTVTTLGWMLFKRTSPSVTFSEDSAILPLLLLTLAFGGIGFADDYLSAKRGKNLGLRAREKFGAQLVVAIGFAFWLAGTAKTGWTTQVELAPIAITSPFTIDLGWWYYPLAVLFLVGFSNATNITDGLDGLSSGLGILICLAMAGLLYAAFPALGLFTTILAGALAGFLWWNAHKAQVFMGDTFSLALGAALAGVALIGKQEIGLIVASLVCWAELFSVMIQVSVFQWRKRTRGLDYAKANRVFKRSPLHHHFEELGWHEMQVVLRFWIAGALCAGLALLWGRG